MIGRLIGLYCMVLCLCGMAAYSGVGGHVESVSDDVRAIDGDTLVARVGLVRVHLRLNGIDAPELPGHCRAGRHCAPGDPFASKANMAALVNGKRVEWQDLGRDRYGRTIAEVKVGSLDVQCAQIRGGFAIYKPRWDNLGTLAKVCR